MTLHERVLLHFRPALLVMDGNPLRALSRTRTPAHATPAARVALASLAGGAQVRAPSSARLGLASLGGASSGGASSKRDRSKSRDDGHAGEIMVSGPRPVSRVFRDSIPSPRNDQFGYQLPSGCQTPQPGIMGNVYDALAVVLESQIMNRDHGSSPPKSEELGCVLALHVRANAVRIQDLVAKGPWCHGQHALPQVVVCYDPQVWAPCCGAKSSQVLLIAASEHMINLCGWKKGGLVAVSSSRKQMDKSGNQVALTLAHQTDDLALQAFASFFDCNVRVFVSVGGNVEQLEYLGGCPTVDRLCVRVYATRTPRMLQFSLDAPGPPSTPIRARQVVDLSDTPLPRGQTATTSPPAPHPRRFTDPLTSPPPALRRRRSAHDRPPADGVLVSQGAPH